MYSRRRRSSNLLHESELALLRQRRDSEVQHQMDARARLQADFVPPESGADDGGSRHRSSSGHASALRRLSESLRRRRSHLPNAEDSSQLLLSDSSSRALPDAGLGPLASAVRFKAIGEEDVIQFLNAHPDVLNHYVEQFIDAPTLKDWLSAKTSGAVRSVDQLARGRYSERHVAILKSRLLEDVEDVEHVPRMVHELAAVAAAAVHADAFTLYLIDSEKEELSAYTSGKDDFVKHSKSCIKIAEEATPAALAAATEESLIIDSIAHDKRFSLGFGPGVSEKDRSGLVAPIPSLAVIELRRGQQHEPFELYHLETVNALLSWFHIALTKLKTGELAQQQEEFNAFLLEVAQSLFEDVYAQDTLISKIMIYAKSLVSAERVTFFALEPEQKELVASLFDDGEVANGVPVLTKRHEIRFSVDQGIAGHCAKYGQLVNVKDAYRDPRFNSDVDRKTGYTSRGLLAYPVVAKGRVLGVLQVVNKIGGESFAVSDEAALRMFGIYCSLALRHGSAHERSKKQEHELNVCRDMLTYHSSASLHEQQKYFKQPLPSAVPANFMSFGFAPSREESLNRLYVYLYLDLCGASRVKPEHLVTFVTTVIKSYRAVPYHNAMHAFMVAHTMYLILKLNSNSFSRVEMMALVIACLCHDADHRGYSNTFAKASTSLGALYKTSIMENHHFNVSVAIMRRPGHDVLSELSAQERKEALDIMHEAIIATDLAVYFQQRPKLEKVMNEGQFNITNQLHRTLLRNMMMTTCDLSAITKPSGVVLAHTLRLYVEFHEQGDKEKEQGLTPDAMMDRSKAMNLPADQITFIKYLCLPAYQLVYRVFPNIQEMMDNVQKTLEFWRDTKEKGTTAWKPYPSWPEPQEPELRVNLPPAVGGAAVSTGKH